MAHRDPLARAQVLHRKLVTRCRIDGVPQVVFKARCGGFDMVALGSPRLESLQRQDRFFDRVVGSFTESASVALLASAIRSVA